MRLFFIGIGAMGGAVLNAALRVESFKSYKFCCLVRRGSQIAQRSEEFSDSRVEIKSDFEWDVSEEDLIFLGVKPQDFSNLVPQLKGKLPSQTVLVSMMTGISTKVIKGSFHDSQPVIRVMPNLPIFVGDGVTCGFRTLEVEDDSRASFVVEKLFSESGTLHWLGSEELINAATAVSGSGPGYLAFLIQALIDASSDLGFEPGEAKLLVRETIEGTLRYWRETGQDLPEIQKRVSSKGGTTEAAIMSLKGDEVPQALQRALQAAKGRAVELSGGGD